MPVTDEGAEQSPDGTAVAGTDAGRAALSPDVSARDWTRTRTSDATTPPPPVQEAVAEATRTEAAGSEPAEPAPAHERVRPTAAARRPPLLQQGLGTALAAGALAGGSALGVLPLAAAVLVLQVLLVLGVLVLLDAPAARGACAIAVGSSLAAGGLVLADDGRVDRVAGVVGLGLVASLVHQLVRKGRSRVTESLADTLLAVVVASAAVCLVALHQLDGGPHVLLVSLAAAASALLVGRVVDRWVPRPLLAVGATRGWPGLLLALAAGVGVAVLVAPTGAGDLPLRSAALLGLLVAATVATADLAVDLGAAELRAGWRDARRVAALRPTALLLPYALLGPVALLAGRLVLT